MSSQVLRRRAGKYQPRTVFTDSTDVIMQQNVTSMQLRKSYLQDSTDVMRQ